MHAFHGDISHKRLRVLKYHDVEALTIVKMLRDGVFPFHYCRRLCRLPLVRLALVMFLVGGIYWPNDDIGSNVRKNCTNNLSVCRK